MSDALVEFFKHNLWANQKLLAACKGLTEEQLHTTSDGTYGRISDTLVHIVSAEEYYVGLINGQKLENRLRVKDGFPGLQVLREHAQHSGEGLVAIAKNFDGSRILQQLHPSEPDNLHAVTPLLQAMNHATEHRAHIMTIMSQLGVEPPSLDAWAYNKERFG